ncbi:unnamed protein product, partial [Owenia fusiformis]
GANSYGQLGQGHIDDKFLPTLLPTNECIFSLSGGGGHTLAITETGKLMSCGWNNKGQLGLGHTNNIFNLSYVDLPSKIIKAAGGWDFTLCLTEDNNLYTWGSNAFGQLGSAEVKGCTLLPIQINGAFKVKDISAGLRHAIIVTDKGDIFTWGFGKNGQLGHTHQQDVSSKRPSHVYPNPEALSLPESIGQPIMVIAGSHHSGFLTNTGQVWIWGCNKYGQCARDLDVCKVQSPCAVPQGFFNNEKIVLLKGGWTHMLAVTESGAVYSWGRGDYGQLGRPCNAKCDPRPQKIVGLQNLVTLCCGSEHNMAITEDCRFLCWGWNEHGMCGTGDEVNVDLPRPAQLDVIKTMHLTSVCCGSGHCFLSCQAT